MRVALLNSSPIYAVGGRETVGYQHSKTTGLAAGFMLALSWATPAVAQGASTEADLYCAVEKLKGEQAFKSCQSQYSRSRNPTRPTRAATATAQEIDCAVEKLRGKAEFERCMSGGAAAAAPTDVRPGLFEHMPEPVTKGQSASAARFPMWKPVSAAMSAVASGEHSPVELFRRLAPSVYIVVAQSPLETVAADKKMSQGSAVAITAEMAVTNCHVLAGYGDHYIVRDNRMWPLQIVAADTASDRCVVRSPHLRLEPVAAVRSSSAVAIGEKVYTIGSPKGLDRTLGEGLVSGFRVHAGRRVVQTSAPISGGSSGGGLFDSAGNLIGVTSFKEKDSENLNFAIAIEEFWR
jgi:hypothetical protein